MQARWTGASMLSHAPHAGPRQGISQESANVRNAHRQLQVKLVAEASGGWGGGPQAMHEAMQQHNLLCTHVL